MRVLVTGATGYVGYRVATRLREQHDVVGLTRSSDGEQRLKAAGIVPLRADLNDAQTLTSALRDCDGVIHTAFDHSADWRKAVEVDHRVHRLMIDVLAGSGKPLVTSNGMGVFGDTAKVIVNENTPVTSSPRVEVERIALNGATRGVRVCSIRLALLVYGHSGSVFVPAMIRAAQTHGVSFCIDSGSNLMSAVHVDDAADLYVRAFLSASAGSVYHAASGSDVTLRQIADSIGRMLGVAVQSVSLERAREVWHPTWAGLLSITNRTSGEKAQQELGWRPKAMPSLLDDIERGSYRVQ